MEELLGDLRAEAVREIRPPGAAAARRTVRRRRFTAAIATAGAVVLSVSGVFALVDRPEAGPGPTLPAASPSVAVTPLPAAALAAITDGDPAFEVAAPVVAGYERTTTTYLPQLTLRAACAGAGQVTLVVRGDIDGDTKNRFPDREVARVKLTCGADPVPVNREINASTLPILTFRLEQADSAVGRAGLAYRLTAAGGGAPLAPDDAAASVPVLLGLTGTGPASKEPVRAGGHTPEDEPMGTYRKEGWHAEFPDELYTLAVACRGTGMYGLEIRHAGKVLAALAVECSWPPLRREFEIPGPLGKDVEFWSRYDADPGQRAETGWALHLR
jgi:hypothetical protein